MNRTKKRQKQQPQTTTINAKISRHTNTQILVRLKVSLLSQGGVISHVTHADYNTIRYTENPNVRHHLNGKNRVLLRTKNKAKQRPLALRFLPNANCSDSKS